jgi:hypothetical protein
MRHRQFMIPVVIALAAVAPAAVATSTGPDPGIEPSSALDVARRSLPGEALRAVDTRQYSMSGSVRPLLFWFGRDDIGLARVVWRVGADGARGYELLVGTDPAKAPRALNRWGFISEEVHGAEGAVLALMTGADESSYDEAADSADRRGGGSDFRAIQSQVQDGTTAWQTVRVQTPGNFSVHDVDSALDRVRDEASAAHSRHAALPDGARPGFLVALADLIDAGAGNLPASEPGRRALQKRVRYVFGQGTYELHLREAQRSNISLNGGTVPVVRSSFEIRTLSTDARTRFEVMFGTQGALAGIPVAASWQPRWWLKVELRLSGTGAA